MGHPQLPAATQIGRVTLRVGSIDDVLPFYRDTVGLATVERDGNTATIGTGDTHLLRLVEDPDAPSRSASGAGLFHLAIRVPDRGSLADALERINERPRLTGRRITS